MRPPHEFRGSGQRLDIACHPPPESCLLRRHEPLDFLGRQIAERVAQDNVVSQPDERAKILFPREISSEVRQDLAIRLIVELHAVDQHPVHAPEDRSYHAKTLPDVFLAPSAAVRDPLARADFRAWIATSRAIPTGF